MPDATSYRGRFAPSPTGPLHFGSLIAATGSYLQARSQQGEWWLRIENIDPPREPAGVDELIIRTLETYGFEWDGPIQYQGDRIADYKEALATLHREGVLYACDCSRKHIAQVTKHTGGPLRYPGLCRNKGLSLDSHHALRVIIPKEAICFNDAIQGNQSFNLQQLSGDFVLKRVDGLISYQLAVAFDDAEQGMTEVVRGSDLLDSTPRQIYLQRLLGLTTPAYAHLPVATDARTGSKLSKQNLAPALDHDSTVPTLWQALDFLGQQPPEELKAAHQSEFWQWALQHWDLKSVPTSAAIYIDV